MRKKTLLFLIVIGIISCAAALCMYAAPGSGTAEARLLRFPATDGKDVVFSFAGDLYKAPLEGGTAERLTSYVGYEMFARFSPRRQKHSIHRRI
jgi:tricorn protease-like protein